MEKLVIKYVLYCHRNKVKVLNDEIDIKYSFDTLYK